MIDCNKIANEIKERLKPLVSEDKGLAIIQVGDNPASNIYVRNKIKDCEELGIPVRHYHLDESKTTEDILSLIDYLNHNPNTKGVICQLPLPEHIDTDRVVNAISDDKDVDGFKVTSKYIPATPKGVMTILDNVVGDLTDKNVVLVGKGKTTNMPLIPLLLDERANVTILNSKTTKIHMVENLSKADVIISAVGRPNIICDDVLGFPYSQLSRKDNELVIIDVGISRVDGKQVGDCARELHDGIENVTPFVNGVGLMTRVSLLQNLLED